MNTCKLFVDTPTGTKLAAPFRINAEDPGRVSLMAVSTDVLGLQVTFCDPTQPGGIVAWAGQPLLLEVALGKAGFAPVSYAAVSTVDTPAAYDAATKSYSIVLPVDTEEVRALFVAGVKQVSLEIVVRVSALPGSTAPTNSTFAQAPITILASVINAEAAPIPVASPYLRVADALTMFDALGSAAAVQAALDAHIADTANPHAVTKAQVGLGSVTDDAQVKRSEMGVAEGVATLGVDGKVVSTQIPDALLGALQFQGNWNAETNTPAVSATGGPLGKFWLTTTAGVLGGVEFAVGDWVLYTGPGIAPIRVLNSDAVVSVNGRIGAVVTLLGDIVDMGAIWNAILSLNDAAAARAALGAAPALTVSAGADWAPTAADDGKVKVISPAAPLTIILPAGVPSGVSVAVVQGNDNTITFAPDTGVTILSFNDLLSLAGANAGAVLLSEGGGVWRLVGNLA